jgi:hypothetical protein
MGKRIVFKPSRLDAAGDQGQGSGEELRTEAFEQLRRKAEEAGAKLIAEAYLDSLGEMGQACASVRFLPEMRKRILDLLEKGWGPHGPRNFDTARHFKKLRGISTNREETVLMRYKAGCRLGYAEHRFAAQVIIEPFDPQEWMRKPRHATHYRFIITAGVLSDYQYSPSSGVYVPLHPELVGVNAWNYTPPIPIHEKLAEPLTFEAHLPGYPELPPTARLVVGLGIEFLFQGKHATFMKSVYRALMVIDVI